MKLLLIITCFLFASNCIAGEAAGKVIEIRALSTSNVIIFAVDSDIEDAASCNRWQTFGIRVGTPGGDAIFELVRFSFLNGLAIEVTGLGTCSAHWRSEDVKDIAVKQATQ